MTATHRCSNFGGFRCRPPKILRFSYTKDPYLKQEKVAFNNAMVSAVYVDGYIYSLFVCHLSHPAKMLLFIFPDMSTLSFLSQCCGHY